MSTTESPTIAARVADLQAGLGDHLAPEVSAVFAGEQAQLERAGIPAGVADVGALVPDGDLLDAHGAPTTLADQRRGRPAVVVFYRGAWCPYCNLALRAYQEQLVPTLTERGIELIAISPQKPDGSLSAAETNELSFSVVSDPGNQIATALGIITAPSEDAIVAARSTFGTDLTQINADGGYGLPMPTVLILDRDGVIRWIDVHPNYTTRTESADILTALTALG